MRSVSLARKLLRRKSREGRRQQLRRAYRRRFRSSFMEALEERIVLSLTPISVIDSSRFGLSALGTSSALSVSDDGQVIAFESDAADIVANDVNGFKDVFVYFRGTGRVELASVNAAGVSANGESTGPQVSPDGRYVMFRTTANEIVPGASGFAPQLAARDLQTGTTIVISADDGGVPGNRPSQNGRWSGDSTKVVFDSDATNFAAIDTNGTTDVFLRDLTTNTTTLLSVNMAGTAAGDDRSFAPQISRDGNHVAFESFAEDLIANDLTNIEDVYVRDLTTGTTDLITIDNTGTKQPTVHSGMTDDAISDDGRYVLFVSADTNFANVPIFNGNNLYRRDRIAGTTTLVSVTADGLAGVGGFSGVMTENGQSIAFVSSGGGLDAAINDTNNTFDVFLRDMVAETTRMVTVNTAGDNGGDGLTVVPRISADGRYVTFFSEAGNLSNDPDGNQDQTNSINRRDVFVRDMQTGVTTNVSSGGNHLSQLHVVSADFKTVAFDTLADNLVPGDRNSRQDVVVRDLNAGVTTLLSRREPSFPAEILGTGGLVSATPDGRYVAFNAGPSQDYAPGVTFTGFQTASAYVRDRTTGKITVVDLTPDPSVSGGGFSPLLTPDGRFAAFWSRVPTGGSTPLVDGIDFTVGDFFFGRDMYLRDLATGVTQLVSVDPTGTQANNGQGSFTRLEHAISDDGRYVAFTSKSDNLVGGLTNPSGFTAIYQRDTWTNTTVLVSHNLADDGTISGQSYNSSMSADGRFITFTSEAPDLTANDNNAKPDVFRWDRTIGLVALVSINDAGTESGNDDSGGVAGFRPVMTSNGRYISFASRASDLITSDDNNRDDVFVRDMESGTTTLVSVNKDGTGGGNQSSTYANISDDGQKITFISRSNDLNELPTSAINQAYVRDMQAGVTQTVSVTADESAAGNDQVVATTDLNAPTISAGGRYVVFQSKATDLVDGFVDANGANDADIYVRDSQTHTTHLLTSNQAGTASGGDSSISFRYLFVGTDPTEVIFDTAAPDIFPGDRNAGSDIFAFPIVGSGQIQGTVFADADKDGALSGGETGLPDVAVYLDRNGNGRPDTGETRLITDADGMFAFTNMPAGTYAVGVLLPNGFDATSPRKITVVLPTDSSVVAEQNFGAAAAVADLAVTNLAAPAAVAAGRPFTVTWTTANFANQAIAGDWQEAVYVSADNVLDSSDRLLGTLAHTGGLGASSSVGRSLSVAAPASLTGDYFVFVQTDRRMQVPADTNRTNNLAFAFDPLTIAIPELTFAAPVSDAFDGPNQDRFFRIVVEPGKSVRLTLDSDAAAGGAELYASFNEFPSPFNFDHVARAFGQPDQTLTIPLTRPGTYFVLARSRFGEAASAPFTLTAEDASFKVESVGPNSGPASGRVTVEIRGTGFSFNTVPTLEQGGTVIDASMIDLQDASLLYATFDLAGQPTGVYDVRLQDGPDFDTQVGGFSVDAAQAQEDALQLFLLNPEFARLSRVGKVAVEYVNTGDTDIPAPLLRLTATHADLRLPGQPTFGDGDLTFYGSAGDDPAGMLRRGQRGRVDLEFLSTGTLGGPITFQTFFSDHDQLMDWAAIKDGFRPASIAPDAWDAIFENFLAEAGTTVGEYEAMLARSASYLSSLGVHTADTTRLLNLALAAADASFTAAMLATVDDSFQPASGFNLLFRRQHAQAIHGRYEMGPFGRGWTHDWDAEATTLPGGEVEVRFGIARRLFVSLPDGSFVGTNGDAATLSLASGMFTLTEIDGSAARFRADGMLETFTDSNGNQVTATYDGSGRLTSLAHSSGPTVNLTYNAAGFIDTLTDSAGRTVNYAYTGDHLTGYTDQYGSHTYTYLTGVGAAREHSLESVNFSDDTQVTFAYDERGRLITEERDGGQQRLTYEYLPIGGFNLSDASGASIVNRFDDFGRYASITNAFGQSISFAYDANQNVTAINAPEGISFDFTYDGLDLVAATDALGNLTQFTSDTRQNLTRLTDSLGRLTRYSYDDGNNLLNIQYPNSTTRSYVQSSVGSLISTTNRRGETIEVEPNAAGQFVKRTQADGAVSQYAYDERGRLTSASDDSGTIEIDYSSLDQPTKISYPDGKFLAFEYNIVGQRTKRTDQDGFTLNYIYDDLGRLERVTDSSDDLIVQYVFDAAGRLMARTNGNGTSTDYEYDFGGRLVTLTHSDKNGAINAKLEYTYDSLGRQDSATLTDSDPNTTDGATRYKYDPLGQLISVELADGRRISYEYDAVGNRLRMIDDVNVTDYAVNQLNEHSSVGAVTFTYDADGNLRSKLDSMGATTYEFDDEDRLVSVHGPGISAEYTYNAFGQRDSATINGQTTEYLLDPVGLWSIAAEYNDQGDAVARYADGFGIAARVASDGSASFYDFDHSGNTIGLTDATGNYVNRYSYLPFGETTTIRGALQNPFTYVGVYGAISDGSGLVNMRFRNYDSLTGAFVSDDPIGLLGGDANLRRYVGNNPVMFADPSGLQQIISQPNPYNPNTDSFTVEAQPYYAGDGSAANGSLPQYCPLPSSQRQPDYSKFKNGLWRGAIGAGIGGLIGIIGGGPGIAAGAAAGFAVGSGAGFHTGPLSFLGGDPRNAPTGGGGSNGNGDNCDNRSGPGNDPGGPSGPGPGGPTNTVGGFDPNDITGPVGVGAEHFIVGEQTLPYTIRFENIDTATAPAQEVFVTHQLDADLDLSTFELDDVGFGDVVVVDMPNGLQSFATSVAYQNTDGSPLRVDVSAELDADTRTVTWTFRSIDPATGLLPEGVFDGFLPPNVNPSEGEGFVSYVIRANSGLTTGTTIDQQASIVFDINDPILTNVYTNTIDSGAPTSSVDPLPVVTTADTFTVSWSGTDDASGATGSGIAMFDVFVSADGDPFEPFLLRTGETSAEFMGEAGRNYGFFSVATDHLNHRQPTPSAAQATTTVAGGLDFGDAPDGIEVDGVLRSYPTLIAENGAQHIVGSGLVLGATVDAESDGQPTAGADGDGANDDGVRFIAAPIATTISDTTASFLVTASAMGKLDAWIDFNRDGNWLDAGEQLFATSIDLIAGDNIVSYSIPSGASAGDTYARFRLSSAGGLAPDGPADDGEVEDYLITILDGDLGAHPTLDLIVGDVEVIADGNDVVVRHDGIELFRAPGSVLASGQFLGTAGDDTLSLGNLESALAAPIPLIYDGGPGRDSLILTGSNQILDLTDRTLNQLSNLEVIDIVGASPNELILDEQSVLDATDANNTLLFQHDEDDTAHYQGTWNVLSPGFVDNVYVHILEQGSARVLVLNTLPWQNPVNRLDSDRDGQVAPVDVLVNFNTLNDKGTRQLPAPTPTMLPEFYYDSSGDGFVSPVDPLQRINFLNDPSHGLEGESPLGATDRSFAAMAGLFDHGVLVRHIAAERTRPEQASDGRAISVDRLLSQVEDPRRVDLCPAFPCLQLDRISTSAGRWEDLLEELANDILKKRAATELQLPLLAL